MLVEYLISAFPKRTPIYTCTTMFSLSKAFIINSERCYSIKSMDLEYNTNGNSGGVLRLTISGKESVVTIK